jgi:tetratricopeptide (TPR) repeat protein
LYRQQNWPEAIHHYGEAARLRPRHPDTHLNLGYACYHLGKSAEAMAAWRVAVAQSPQDALPHLSLAIGFLARENRPQARHHLARALELDPNWKDRVAIDVRWTPLMVTEINALAEEDRP